MPETKTQEQNAEPSRAREALPKIAIYCLAIMTLLSMAVAPVAAHANDNVTYKSCEDLDGDKHDESTDRGACHAELQNLENTFDRIGNLIVLLVVAIAVPNGAYGFLQWMTANDSVEKDDRGRSRIRNTFIALGGVAVIRILVEAVKIMII